MIKDILQAYISIGLIIGLIYVFYYFKYKHVKPSKKQDYRGKEVSITYGKTALIVSVLFTYLFASLLFPLVIYEIVTDIFRKEARI